MLLLVILLLQTDFFFNKKLIPKEQINFGYKIAQSLNSQDCLKFWGNAQPSPGGNHR